MKRQGQPQRRTAAPWPWQRSSQHRSKSQRPQCHRLTKFNAHQWFLTSIGQSWRNRSRRLSRHRIVRKSSPTKTPIDKTMAWICKDSLSNHLVTRQAVTIARQPTKHLKSTTNRTLMVTFPVLSWPLVNVIKKQSRSWPGTAICTLAAPITTLSWCRTRLRSVDSTIVMVRQLLGPIPYTLTATIWITSRYGIRAMV